MKINSITPNTGHLKSRTLERSSANEREYGKNSLQNKNEQINTAIKRDSDGRVSFKGGVPFLHKAANFAADNPLVAEALFAMVITCGLRPLTIMATAKTDEDKEKCAYQAAKSVSSGVVGLATTALIGAPIAAATKAANNKGAFNMPPEMKEKSLQTVKKGVDALSDLARKLTSEGKQSELTSQIASLTEGGKINLGVFKKAGKNAEKVFKEKVSEVAPEISETVKKALSEQQILNNYSKTGKNVIDKFFQPIFMPIRANITVALVPVILGLLGLKKASSAQKPAEAQAQQPLQSHINYNMFQTTNEKELFQSFAGVTNYENK